jgi:prepilin-type N-terminal cleavage/methylation domain-containing protein/prepilin-type processing-associated H-X9-DG protein
MKPSHLSDRRGGTDTHASAFTLVELLVVVAVLALLVTLTVPSYNAVRAIAETVKCRAHLRGAGIALRMYLDENEEIMPVAAAMPSLDLNDEPRIVDVLGRQLGSPDLLRCPSDKRYYKSEGSSYQYNTNLGGRQVKDSFLTRRWGEDKVPVMHDYEPFHGEPDTPGAMNYLFADCHVGDLVD